MNRPIRSKIHSLSLGARIVWVFIFTAIFSVFIFNSAFKLLTQPREEQVFPRLIADYAHSLIVEMGEPVLLSKAQSIAQRTGMEIFIERENQIIGTSSNKPQFDNKALEFNINGLVHQIQHHRGRAMLRIKKPHENIIFVISFHHAPGQTSFIFFAFIVSMILVIYIAYRMVRYLIAPIKSIEYGVQKFSNGDLNYRIKKMRNDDLGVLTEHINQMAGQLNTIIDAKRQLLLAISHELRTPMTRMKITLELPHNEKNRQRINKSLGQMETLLGELLESEKLAAKHQLLEFKKVSLNEIITSFINQEYYETKQITLCLTEQSTEIMVDTMRICLLLRNLIGNAVKYGLKRPITVSTSIIENKVQLSVVDEGEGISEESINQVFEPFYREDQARQRQTGGTGLGLYLVKLIVNAHDGEINLFSNKGQGTRVLVKFNSVNTESL